MLLSNKCMYMHAHTREQLHLDNYAIQVAKLFTDPSIDNHYT